MISISLCMIVKNEEELLGQCLRSVQAACDEIIIVDTGSTDRTKEVAGEFTDKIYDFSWIDDFSAARNYSFSQGTQDYLMWLDADDVLLEEDLKKLLELKETLDLSVDVVSMNYHTVFDETGNPTFAYRRNRLVKRVNQFRWFGLVHEYLAVGGNNLPADIAVTHQKSKKTKQDTSNSGRNLRIYENYLQNGGALAPRDMFYYANELRDHKRHEDAIQWYRTFLEGKQGWREDNISASFYLADCYAAVGDREKSTDALFHVLVYGDPKPEACCRIGNYFIEENDFSSAVFWFHAAIRERERGAGFENLIYATWFPQLQLCLCYWRLGMIEKAIEHNEKAAEYKPEDARVLHNRNFFNSMKSEK